MKSEELDTIIEHCTYIDNNISALLKSQGLLNWAFDTISEVAALLMQAKAEPLSDESHRICSAIATCSRLLKKLNEMRQLGSDSCRPRNTTIH